MSATSTVENRLKEMRPSEAEVARRPLRVRFALAKQALPTQNEPMTGFAFNAAVSGLVVLAISHCGETQFPLQSVKDARLLGVKCIGLTNEPASELARAADVLRATQAGEPRRGNSARAPRICQLAVLDTLVSCVDRLSKRYETFRSPSCRRPCRPCSGRRNHRSPPRCLRSNQPLRWLAGE